MNDEFLHELRTPPSPAFAARLKRQLDSKAAVASSRKGYWLLGLLALSILGSTAVAFVLPARNAVAVIIQRIAGAPAAPVAPANTEPPAAAANPPSPFAAGALQGAGSGVQDAANPSASTSSASVPAASGAAGSNTAPGSLEPSVIPRSSNLIARDARPITSVAVTKELQPLVDVVSQDLAKSRAPVDVLVHDVPDSGAALLNFCARGSDIALSDRPIAAAEIDACKQNGVAFVEFPIAYDAAVIVVNPQNKWADSITPGELERAWRAHAQDDRTPVWYDLRPTWPTLPLTVSGRPAEEHARGEDEATVTARVANDFGGLGSVSYGQYVTHASELRAVAVVNRSGSAVLPSGQTVRDGSYELTRRILVYSRIAMFSPPAASEFVGRAIASSTWYRKSTGYLMLSDADYRLAQEKYIRGARVAPLPAARR